MGITKTGKKQRVVFLQLRIIAIGHKMPAWVTQGYQEYAKRIRGDLTLTLTEIPMQKRAKSISSKKLAEKEGDAILAAMKPKDYLVALDLNAKMISTEKLATQLNIWQQAGKSVALVIGGPDGLSQSLLTKADEKIALSPMTLPHPLVRVILAEQLYRAWSLNQGHPYHR